MTSSNRLEAYNHCRNIAIASNSSFPGLFKLLSKRKRDGMYAIYAYCRVLDDIADSELPVTEREQKLHATNLELQSALADKSADLLSIAVADTIRYFDLPLKPFEDLLLGMLADLQHVRITDETALLEYCDRVAGTVGLLIVRLSGAKDPIADEYAIATGRALQLTNILRDFREDYERFNRIYLPSEWLPDGFTESTVAENPTAQSVTKALDRIANLAHEYYSKAQEYRAGYEYPGRLRFSELLSRSYHLVLHRVIESGYNGNLQKPVSTAQILRLLIQVYLKP